MTRHTDAELLEAMRFANISERQKLAAELNANRQDRIAARQEEEGLEVMSTVKDRLTPVFVHGLSSTETDWLNDAAPNYTTAGINSIASKLKAEASRWFSSVHPAVRQDRQEFVEQARGIVSRTASQYGTQAPRVSQIMLRHIASLYKVAEGTDLAGVPSAADGETNPNATDWSASPDVLPAADADAYSAPPGLDAAPDQPSPEGAGLDAEPKDSSPTSAPSLPDEDTLDVTDSNNAASGTSARRRVADLDDYLDSMYGPDDHTPLNIPADWEDNSGNVDGEPGQPGVEQGRSWGEPLMEGYGSRTADKDRKPADPGFHYKDEYSNPDDYEDDDSQYDYDGAKQSNLVEPRNDHPFEDEDTDDQWEGNDKKESAYHYQGSPIQQAARHFLGTEEGQTPPIPGEVDEDQDGEAKSSLPYNIGIPPETQDNFITPAKPKPADSNRAPNVSTNAHRKTAMVCPNCASSQIVNAGPSGRKMCLHCGTGFDCSPMGGTENEIQRQYATKQGVATGPNPQGSFVYDPQRAIDQGYKEGFRYAILWSPGKPYPAALTSSAQLGDKYNAQYVAGYKSGVSAGIATLPKNFQVAWNQGSGKAVSVASRKEAGLPQLELADMDETVSNPLIFGNTETASVDGRGAADVANIPTPGKSEADYPQPNSASPEPAIGEDPVDAWVEGESADPEKTATFRARVQANIRNR